MHSRLVNVGLRGISVRSLGGDRAGEMCLTRLLRNKKFSVEAMTQTAVERVGQQVKGRHILAIQDTTSLRADAGSHSINAHPVIAVDAEDGALLGLVHAEILVRKGGKRSSRKQRDFIDKESRRWHDGACAAARLSTECGASCVTVISDSEADIYEHFALKPDGVELLVRACRDRCTGEEDKLFSRLSAAALAGHMEIDLPAVPGRAARRAKLAVRYCQVKLVKPQGGGKTRKGLASEVTLYGVDVEEIDVPDGAPPVHWRLLTSHAVDSFEKAKWIAWLYRQRWTIEEVFRTLKTRGFDIERVTIAEGPFEKLAVAAIIAAITVMQLVRARDGTTGRSIEDVFESHEKDVVKRVSKSLEGKTEKQKNPHPEDSLAFASWVCARLGGWNCYYGKPGPIVMLKGLHRLRAIQQGWELAIDV